MAPLERACIVGEPALFIPPSSLPAPNLFLRPPQAPQRLPGNSMGPAEVCCQDSVILPSHDPSWAFSAMEVRCEYIGGLGGVNQSYLRLDSGHPAPDNPR